MSVDNQSCENSGDLKTYQHHVYAVWYSLILAPGLLGNVLALWVFRVYIKETKKAVVFMMNLAVADLLQVRFPSIFYAEKNVHFGNIHCFCFFSKIKSKIYLRAICIQKVTGSNPPAHLSNSHDSTYYNTFLSIGVPLEGAQVSLDVIIP